VTQGATQGAQSYREAQPTDSDIVLLTVPADGAYLGVLRTAAAGLAARLHFTLDEIEDLRIAVDEACAMLIRLATPAAALRCRFALTDDELGVEVAVPTAPDATLPAPSSFAWKVLTALAGSPSASVVDATATIALTARRSELR
jgi:serine/threonine-protein kinase RsbW